METKVCTKCGVEKLLSEYYRQKVRPDGTVVLKAQCKKCVDQTKKKWSETNPDKAKQYIERWYEKNYGSVHEYSKQQWEKKRGTLVERQCKNEKCGKLFTPEHGRQRYCSDKCRSSQTHRNYDKRHEYSKKRYAKQIENNPPKVRKPGPNAIERTCTKCGETKPANEFQKGRNICKVCWKVVQAAQHQRHKAYYKQKTRERKMRRENAEGFHTDAEWLALKAKHAYTCLCCGKTEPTISLTRDHVKPLIHGGTDYIDNIQPLCHGCNSKKNDKEIDYR